jgi:hypothetical protein
MRAAGMEIRDGRAGLFIFGMFRIAFASRDSVPGRISCPFLALSFHLSAGEAEIWGGFGEPILWALVYW